ncbi:MAG: flagellar basal body-associated protein FliL [Planctomycetaceae bacterium]
MTAPTPSPAENGERPVRSGTGLVVWLGVGLVSAAVGATVPLLLAKNRGTTQEAASEIPNSEFSSADKVMFVPFGDVTVNLNEGRMNRYLRIKLSVQIDRSQEQLVTAALEKQGLIIRNWLISYLSDKELDAIRGAAGQNMLRREIRDQFNAVLFTDGYDRVHDVLFEEFNVQ